MRLLFALIASSLLVGSLSGCAPVVVGGAAAGGLMAADRRTSGAYIEDQSIELKAEKHIGDKLGDKIHVNVTSFNRNVLITGEAIDEPTKQSAENIAKDVENIRSVTNELIIAGASSMSSRSNDSYLTSKVKTRMITENKFPANYVKVVTENSTVYLMGMVTRKEAEDAVEIARDTDGVQKVVKVFEYVVVE
jgi:osmotically-inducible protein OsmY